MSETTKKARNTDDKYKNAALDAIEERMRIDNFAPSILNAINSDVSLRNGIKNLVAEAISEKKSVQDAISNVVDQNQTNKIYKILKNAVVVIVTTIITAVITWLITRVLPSN